MNEAQAKRIAMGTFIAVAGVVGWSEVAKKGSPLPPAKTLVALVVLAAGLAVGVEVAPEFAGPLALLFGLAIVTSRIPSGKSKFFSTYAVAEPSGGIAAQGTYTSPSGHPVGG